MKSSLQQLLNQFDAIMADHEEIGDPAVRARMSDVIYHALLAQTPGYAWPVEVGMFTPEGNEKLLAALRLFVEGGRKECAAAHLSTPEQRFRAFQNPSVASEMGNHYYEYFGHAEHLEHLAGQASGSPAADGGRRPWWKFWSR